MSDTNTDAVASLPDFDIHDSGPMGKAFMDAGIHSFHAAARHIHGLAYRRNANKEDLRTVLSDACGTCSTKHALLKALADEHGIEGMELVLGIVRMSGSNTRAVAKTLATHGLEYMPEAHNYLKWNGEIIDLTWPGVRFPSVTREVMKEIVIAPHQITDFKVSYHRAFLQQWLEEQVSIAMSLDELWSIREQCIRDMGG